MTKLKTYKSVIHHFEQMPEEIQWYFEHLTSLIEQYPYDIAIAYLFSNIEIGHNSALYCGVVKLHKVDPELAWNSIDNEHMTRERFRELVAVIFGNPLSKNLIATIEKAEKIRDQIMHGGDPEEQASRDAIRDILDYAKGLNREIQKLGGFKPYSRLTGFKGRGKSLDKSTSRWILKGIGFKTS